MRALQLVFGLHHPYTLRDQIDDKEGYFAGAEEFRAADKREYQPLFALLERNAQRYPKLKVSLVASGLWLEQAEKWSPELVKRLKKLVTSGNVEIIATPYYDSLAAFYDTEEFAAQVRRDQEKIEGVLGAKMQFLALPEYLYNNRLARWAEKADFVGMLAGDATKVLDWRDGNRPYDAKGCENLKVLFMNPRLIDVVERADAAILAQEKINDAERTVYAAAKFQKMLDLASLRGNLLNLYFESSLFDERKELGIATFFDDLVEHWMEHAGYRLVSASEAAKLPATAEISVKKTISRVGQAEKDYALPSEIIEPEIEQIYVLREKVMATKDRDLYVDFARLTTYGLEKGKKLAPILADLTRRASELGAGGATEAAENTERGVSESHRVTVNIKRDPVKKAKTAEFIKKVKDAVGDEPEEWLNDLDDAEAAVQVLAQRISWQSLEKERDVTDLAEAELVGDEKEVAVEASSKKGLFKKASRPSAKGGSKKIVIE